MELYIEPKWAKKDTKFKKGHAAWNKGLRGFSTKDPQKIEATLRNLKRGRENLWKTRARDEVWNSIPVSVYDLNGHYLSSHKSASSAARHYCVQERNVRSCISGNRDRAGQYQFRKAKLIIFQGETLVKKDNIDPYKRRNRKRTDRKEKRDEL